MDECVGVAVPCSCCRSAFLGGLDQGITTYLLGMIPLLFFADVLPACVCLCVLRVCSVLWVNLGGECGPRWRTVAFLFVEVAVLPSSEHLDLAAGRFVCEHAEFDAFASVLNH